MKQILFLAVFQAIRLQDNAWANLYERLVMARCPYDEKTQSHVGKKRVIGRVAGQMDRSDLRAAQTRRRAALESSSRTRPTSADAL